MFLKKTRVVRKFVVSITKDSSRIAPMMLNWKNKITVNAAKEMLLVALLILVCNSNVLSQGWEIYFGSHGEDQGRAVIQTVDKGYVAAGFFTDASIVIPGGDNDEDFYIIRTDVDGDKVWEQYYDKGWKEFGQDIIQTSDGNFLLVGEVIDNPIDAEPQASLLKVDKGGEEMWFYTYGGTGVD